MAIRDIWNHNGRYEYYKDEQGDFHLIPPGINTEDQCSIGIIGRKDDQGKPNTDVVLGAFSKALLEVSKVGTDGANDYGKYNWLYVEDAVERYSSAMLRHYLESKTTPIDSKSGHLHLAHMAWNALAVLELTLREMDNK